MHLHALYQVHHKLFKSLQANTSHTPSPLDRFLVPLARNQRKFKETITLLQLLLQQYFLTCLTTSVEELASGPYNYQHFLV